jgi:hypothetical protein
MIVKLNVHDDDNVEILFLEYWRLIKRVIVAEREYPTRYECLSKNKIVKID